MNEPHIIRIFDIVGGPLCISTDDGQTVHDKIAPLLKDGQRVILSFSGVDTLISLFLHVAIGQLYGELTEERIRELLSVQDMAQDDLVLLKRAVENAKAFFKNRQGYEQAWKEEVSDEE
ncbi:DUF4325 domain-containing protein [Candidatus Methylospira mobilis]|uniref:DUF4325 domain-containing protein n=1 Tax=Candidatus Methylospira mobilis TaxID=1808979 RepID=A0A5Q0BM58_9GAMM|nr:STAS-like domain-containing protein [Candidatus Methylospira mobilis]QFY44840.1 DUF4325 domain-containing protein [Candidatus Methylospira mobilis]WNV05613.1 STAS-like domain-containing protein [Candidatus Methylospira mobilis]